MRKSETTELYTEEDSLYWESIEEFEEFEEFSKELVQKVKEELSKHNNPKVITISFEAKNYYEYGENYPYEVIELDFERDLTQEEVTGIEQKELEKNLDKDLSIKLVELGVDVNLAYTKLFLRDVKQGIIKVEGLEL